MLLIIFLILMFLYSFGKFKQTGSEFSIVGLVLSAALLATTIIVLIVNPIAIRSEMAEFNATRASINSARQDDRFIESAAITAKICEANAWLSKVQYLNQSHICDPFIPDDIDELEAIR